MICPLCDKSTKIGLTNILRYGEERSVFYCRDCGLGFLENMESEEMLKQFYADEYRKKYKPRLDKETNAEDLFECSYRFQEDRLKIISPWLDKGKKLLEIGCSAGMFLFNVKDKVKEVVGIELDKKAAAYAEKKCGCKVYTDELIATPLEKKSFDIICAFQVIEHVRYPVNYLMKIREYLKDNGVLYIEAPNLNDVLVSIYDLANHKNFYYHSAHLYYFSKKSLNILFEKAGFEGHLYFMQDYSVLNHFHWILNDMPQSSCMEGLCTPEFPFQNRITDDIKSRMNTLLRRFNEEYKQLLADLEITSNISFVGTKK
ncbi:hypothetical protein KsCSTR_47470 [Candidatus Kuenenia stuttgartiensis]|uniref:Uncharacterized protein n=1 Tax=Kuenenia stuttgartiensis TaxID=174633 RepID=A0A6G7GXP1_KUEST|nr:class I SAM-dependent methyltransferase [Candidatus Kuenenia stuttgartiensis]MCZ7611846.1 class I SAM-dependent methyltransferase [Ignavibacterium sp.]QII14124.1 hypothetical protein KsCSTR_47470 [Candidatus Kuenenia stuttgartiensis]